MTIPAEFGGSASDNTANSKDSQAQHIAKHLIDEIGLWKAHAPADPTTTRNLEHTVGEVDRHNVAQVSADLIKDAAGKDIPGLKLVEDRIPDGKFMAGTINLPELDISEEGKGTYKVFPDQFSAPPTGFEKFWDNLW